MEEKDGFLASITRNIRELMYESGTIKQSELENEILRRLGMFEDVGKHATVKRRIYDALSTFVALEIIKKMDRTLFWVGFPPVEALGSRSAASSSSIGSAQSSYEASDDASLLSTTSLPDAVANDLINKAGEDELRTQIAEAQKQVAELETQRDFYSYFLTQDVRPGVADPFVQASHLPFRVLVTPAAEDAVLLAQRGAMAKAVIVSNATMTTFLTDTDIVQSLVGLQKSMDL